MKKPVIPHLLRDPENNQPQTPQQVRGDKPVETGGPKGPEPTRYGDWEINGKCVDF